MDGEVAVPKKRISDAYIQNASATLGWEPIMWVPIQYMELWIICIHVAHFAKGKNLKIKLVWASARPVLKKKRIDALRAIAASFLHAQQRPSWDKDNDDDF